MKVILLDPSSHNYIQEPYENIGLGYLASVLRENNHEAVIVNCAIENTSTDKLLKRILAENPDVLGLSIKNINVKQGLKIIKELRKRGFKAHITLGGHYPTFHHQELLTDFPEIDSVIRSEGEYALLHLVNELKTKNFKNIKNLSYRIANEIIVNESQTLLTDLDKLPFPARDNTDKILEKSNVISISASRGCYANCSFCSITNFYKSTPGKKWRCRSPKNLVDEIEMLSNKYNINNFRFIDDQLFLSNKQGNIYIKQLRAELEKRNLNIKFIMNCRANNIDYNLFKILQEMGLKKVFIGIESAHQRGLDSFNKGTSVEDNKKALQILESLNINYDIGFILIDPFTTYQELSENLNFLAEIKKRIEGTDCYLSVTTSLEVYGGTPIHKKLTHLNILKGNYINGYFYNLNDTVVKTFRYLMESLIERKLLAIYHQIIFIKRLIINKQNFIKRSYWDEKNQKISKSIKVN